MVLGIPYSSATALNLLPGSVKSSLSRIFSKSPNEYVYGLFIFLVPTGLTMMNCLTKKSRTTTQNWVLFMYAVYAAKLIHSSLLGLV